MNYKAAIFDLDGTIIDSNCVWEKLDRIIFENRKISVSDCFIQKITSMTYEEAADEFAKEGIDITAEVFKEELNKLAVFEYANNIVLKNGVKGYFEYLQRNKVKIALATASPEELFKPVLVHNGIYDYFDTFSTVYDVGKSKDFPDVYLNAAEKLGVLPCECVVFEDVLKGIKSAKCAGMLAIGVYDKYSYADQEKIKEAADDYIYDFSCMIKKITKVVEI